MQTHEQEITPRGKLKTFSIPHTEQREHRNQFPGVPLADKHINLSNSGQRNSHPLMSLQTGKALFPPMHDTNFSEQYKRYATEAASPTGALTRLP